MASLFQLPNGSWAVSEYLGRIDGKHKSRRSTFPDRASAEAFMAAKGLRRRPRVESRTSSEVIAVLADRSALTDSGCVEWIADLTNAGYGRLTWKPDGVTIRGAHRIAYHVLVAPVPRDKVIDHLCRNRRCIRPDHLDVVQQRENVMRSPIAMGAINAAKTHCPQGHEYSPENTYVYTFKTRKTTTRVCRTCFAAYQKKYREQRKAAS